MRCFSSDVLQLLLKVGQKERKKERKREREREKEREKERERKRERAMLVVVPLKDARVYCYCYDVCARVL
jgi:hypothetical protein